MLSAYFGLFAFFSFFVAPLLFRTLDKVSAGLVVGKIFSLYFWTGLIVFIIAFISFVKNASGYFFNSSIIDCYSNVSVYTVPQKLDKLLRYKYS